MGKSIRTSAALLLFVCVIAAMFALWLKQTLHQARDLRAAQWSAAPQAVQPAAVATRLAVGQKTESSPAPGER
jgi:hypothetical protein